MSWESSNEYQRIMEILEDYWLSEPDESEVTVHMSFRHSDGQTQEKCIRWKNPFLRNKTRRIKNLSAAVMPAGVEPIDHNNAPRVAERKTHETV